MHQAGATGCSLLGRCVTGDADKYESLAGGGVRPELPVPTLLEE